MVKLGYCANAWGGVYGHPVGVTSLKDSWYLTPGDTLATLGEVAAAGYEGIELFDGNVAEYADDLGRLRGGLEEAGLALVGVYSGANLVYPEILGDELSRIRQASAWAAELGAEHLVIGGGAQRPEPPSDADYANLAAGLDQIDALASADGLTASFHPHLTTIAESPEQVMRVFEASRIAFCPDTGHLQAGGGDPVELVRELRDRIHYVHIKDIDESGGFVPLGEGVLDVAGVISVLEETGFDGWLTAEADGWPGDPSAGARTSRERLRELLDA